MKRAAMKLHVETGTFVLHLTQPSVTPLTGQNKRRKLNTRKYFRAELPEAAGKKVAGDNAKLTGQQQTPAGSQVLAIEISALAAEDMPLVLVGERQAPTWAHQIV